MTKEDAIESYKRSVELCKARLDIEKMRMDMGEIKELEFYIERDEMAIKALKECTMSKQEAINIKDEILRKEGSIHICNAIAIDGVVLIKDILEIIDKYTEERGDKK